jgi:hypothetical protein
LPEPAKTIVYRHACDCETANRPITLGEHVEHRFEVDGKPFPWIITESGATFEHFAGMYLCTATILPVDPDTREDVDFGLSTSANPTIAGVQFPWLLYRVDVARKDEMYFLTVKFIAENVDTDGPIE